MVKFEANVLLAVALRLKLSWEPVIVSNVILLVCKALRSKLPDPDPMRSVSRV